MPLRSLRGVNRLCESDGEKAQVLDPVFLDGQPDVFLETKFRLVGALCDRDRWRFDALRGGLLLRGAG
jgi:hypothetical protein